MNREETSDVTVSIDGFEKHVDNLLAKRASLAKQVRAIDDELKQIRDRAKAIRDRASGKERKKRGPRKPRQALGVALTQPAKGDELEQG